jgi:uncharacterized protein with HEPN domain/predicted nucleotidyltransferase
MDIADLIVAKSADILRVGKKHGASNIRVFGSAARGEATSGSDVDLLVDVPPERKRQALERMSEELTELLGCKVDVATEADLRPRVRQRALEEAIPLGIAPSMSRNATRLSRMRRDQDQLLDILEAIDLVQKHAPLDALEQVTVKFFVVHQVQTIGEAASRLSEELRLQHADIPWKEIISMRNKIVHGYHDVDIEKAKDAVRKDLPDLRQKVQRILDSFNQSPPE